MRSMWKGAVSFGLVSVPVKMYTATQSHDISFHQVHRIDGGRIKYQRVCSVCGQEVPYADIAKGYQTDDGQMVILTEEDLGELPVTSSREIDVDRFVPAEQIDPMLLEKTYYLEPEKTGIKPYALLREALRSADRMALVKVAIRQRASMAVLRVRDDVIVMQTMLWPDEVRSTDGLSGIDTAVEDLRPQELAMASSLIDTMAGDYHPAEFTDDYREAMTDLLERKLAGGDVTRVADVHPPEEGGAVLDLLAALQKSVAEAKKNRGEDADDGGGADTEGDDVEERSAAGTAGKKTGAAKKTPAARKTSAAKKTRKTA